jgi:glycosyltransferase involved in cell wall biosynthesis
MFRMKIGVMLRNLGEPGGIGMYTTNILTALLTIDKKNKYVLMYQSPQYIGRYSRFPNVTEKALPAPNKLWWDQISVPRFAKREFLELIYNPKLSVPLFTRCKTILVMHGGDQFAAPQTFEWHDRLYFTIANRLYCKSATAIITMTYIGANDIVKYMNADPKKIHVIHESYNELCHVLEREILQGIKEKYSLPDHYILFVGGLEPKKNVTNLLLAYKKISEFLPHKLVFVGFNRWKYSKDLRLVDQLGIRDRVVFTGFVPDEDIPALYNLADLFVFPSFYEGFGMPVLEAMACGCPVVTTKTGCSPEVAGDAALLVNPYDPEEIAESVKKILTDEMLRIQLIEKGLKRVQRFSWHKCAEETLILFESLCNNIV